MTTVR